MRIDSRQVGAVALAGALVVAAISWLAWGWLARQAVAERIAVQTGQIAHLDRRLASLEADGTPQAGEGAPAAVYFPGATAPIAAAAVQRTVDGIIDAAGGRLIESQLLPIAEADPDGHRIDLRTSFEATIESLQAILFEIETRRPIMLVRSLSVRSFVAAGRNDADVDDPVLQVSLVVAAFWEPGEE
ncbi:type II secretion system (T2SS) protein M subtype b [Tepidamorphus gemmatus]|jgi:hypothetical protein|uniref:Type II secretion system (T2SS) protein M subtype b n=1 Tax=Tepidamorphus gemmatus TaxID=747076 RepID=A0A4R3M5J8_9HYPH|nr:type II secretion system protein GspM [Tepidamorphus gemmatus]TCT06505.1 type II secretion system (T2SS) protein M subtype b [Tepidamorphus gemmatus]